MQHKNRSREDIVKAALGLMLQKGLKSLTMDLVAAELAMSKRTLYEIFGNKYNLISEVISYFFKSGREKAQKIFYEAPNTMEALAETFELMSGTMCDLTLKFFRDMDTLYPEIAKLYERNREQERIDWLNIYNRGVADGVFRPDVNMELQISMMILQMETLRRCEPSLLGNFTLPEVFKTITNNYLRCLASHKGIEILENRNKRYSN